MYSKLLIELRRGPIPTNLSHAPRMNVQAAAGTSTSTPGSSTNIKEDVKN